MDLTIGVDVGGTKIAAGVVDPSGAVLDAVRLPTAGDGGSLEAQICEAVEHLAARHPVACVGLAVAGYVDERRAVLRFAPNLSIPADLPLRDLVSSRVGLPVVVENDANAAAWGEYRFGGGRGADDVLMVTLGTGIGGGIVLGGHLVRGAFGGAGEFGHVRVVPGGIPCGCGQRGCWEKYASGTALVHQARDLIAAHPSDGARLLELAGGDADKLDGVMIDQAAAQGDPAARELLAGLGRWLGEGVADLADILDPAVVVIGGGVSAAGDLLLEPARRAYRESLSAGDHRPLLRLVVAELGNEAGLLGAADLARQP